MSERLSVECRSEIRADEGAKILRVCDVWEWLAGLPEGAVLGQITRDFGNQRDPEVRLVGLRASWSEVRP